MLPWVSATRPLMRREVRAEAVLKQILSAAEFPAFLAFRQRRSHRGRRVERRDSSSAGADALRERSLRNQFQFRAPASVELGEDGRVGGARKRTDDLGNAARLEQRREADLAAAAVVADHRQIRGALVDQRVDELDGTARFAETAEHDGGAVENVRDSLGRARDPLVDHSDKSGLKSADTRRLCGSRGANPAPVRVSPPARSRYKPASSNRTRSS